MNKRVMIAVATALASTAVAAGEGQTTSWSIETGLGYESNAYHAPDHSYVDWYADPSGATTVTPEEQAGFYIPLKLQAELVKEISSQTDLLAAYKFNGAFFPDSALSDASATDHEVRVGAGSKLGQDGKQGKAYAGVFISSHDQVYVDRDSGEPKLSTGGSDVSNRYTYTSFGVEGNYERKFSRRNTVGVEGSYESRDYNDPVAWSEYDHTRAKVGGYWEHSLAKGTKLTLGINGETQEYKSRSSYDATGALVGPTLTYTYIGYDIGLRHRFSDSTVAYLDYGLRQRSDNNVGYNDMDESSVKLRLIHDLNDKFRLRAKVAVTERDYPNAFNFEDPAQGAKSASATDVQLRGEYRASEQNSYYLELEQNSHDNTDDRYQYNNTTALLGAKWEF